ncbi:hypothetical protein RJ641_032444 [Dillenia turbinata]|uniref:ATP synthase subunit e, mitochondrial n=1 Tax=Dillenia turbinata TaxID=194707 RepID=A0AAN8W023_9MAGN
MIGSSIEPDHLTYLHQSRWLTENVAPRLRIRVDQKKKKKNCEMAPPPGPYSGTSTLALVARVSAFSIGLAYGSVKLKYLKAKAKLQKKAEAKDHH